ncbi:hypothetical protein SS50377_20210 [Spironucleus salmonicida]|uniref:Uncharacterized protein n=1 Tax=Spironucleus salmonicida TaxID=348837 RepID=V6LNH1_9EUKA|nr:hypothetical protein SS50377_20210 [Spironucleus salmonicida]|eukprot:EST45266.1 hypothetical protein SS50377_14842 [Spironucleus salmonicida]
MRTKTLDSYLENVVNQKNPFQLNTSQKIPPKSAPRVPSHRKPLYEKPQFPSSEYELQQKLKKQNKTVNGYPFEFEKMQQFFGLEANPKTQQRKARRHNYEVADSFFITQNNQNPISSVQVQVKSTFQVSNEQYAKNLRDLKGKIKFNPEIAHIEADSLEKRRIAEKSAVHSLHNLHEENMNIDRQNAAIDSLTTENKLQLESLINVQASLEKKYILIHQQLLEFEQKQQQQQDLKDLFYALEEAFPGQTALNILSKFEYLQELTEKQFNSTMTYHDQIKISEMDSETNKLQFIQQKYISDMEDKQQIYALTNEITQLSKQNSEKNQDVIKAQEIQSQYLQLCQNITTFWIKYGKLFGGDLPQFITPSVNNPLEVLRAMDSIFTCAFPESAKAQDNFKKINGHATHVWQKLLSLDPEQACAKSDTVGMLQKARYLVSCSAAEEKELLGMKQRLQIQKDSMLEDLSEKWKDINQIIQQIRTMGENSEMKWEFALYANAQRDIQNKEISQMQKKKSETKGVDQDFYGI